MKRMGFAVVALALVAGCKKAPGDISLVEGKWQGEPKSSSGDEALAKLMSIFFSPTLMLKRDHTYKMNLMYPSQGHFEFYGDSITLTPDTVLGKTEKQFEEETKNKPLFGRSQKQFDAMTATLSKDGKSLTLDTPEGMPDIQFKKTISDDKLPISVTFFEKRLVGNWHGKRDLGGLSALFGQNGPVDVDLDLKQNNTFEMTDLFTTTGAWSLNGNTINLTAQDASDSMTGTPSVDAKTIVLNGQSSQMTLTKEAP